MFDDLEQGRGFLADDEALALHLLGQQGCGELGAVLDVDGVDVRIGAEREGDREGVAAVRAAGRLVIDRVVDAVDLLLDRLSDGCLHHLGVGAGIKRGQRDLRRHDVRELGHRNSSDGEEAGERNDNRNDKRQPRPVDENVGDHLAPAAGGSTVSCTIWPGRTF